MKYLLTYALLFFLLPDAICQVSGKLVTATNEPLQAATIMLLRAADSTTVKSALSDAGGVFRIDHVDHGKYLLRVTDVGFQTWTSLVFELTAAQPQKDFGNVVLTELNRQLGEVVIRSEKPLVQQEAGGLVVNVQSSILTKGSSVLEVLQRSPGVIINPHDNSITLNGKSGVMVMLDGKLMRMSMVQLTALLNGMSADNIDKIELLNTPPAKYDADGNAGLINIVTKKNKKRGTNGSVTASAGYGKGEKASTSVNLNHNTGKINFYGSDSYSHERGYYNLLASGTENVGIIGGQTAFQYNGLGKPVSGYNSARTGVDVQLNAATAIGASLDYNTGLDQSHSNNRGLYLLKPDSVLLFNANIDGVNHSRNLMGNVYLEREFSKDEKIRVDADYIAYKSYGPTEVESSFVNNSNSQVGKGDSLYSPRQRDLANTLIQVGVAKADYSKQISPKLKLEAGAKGTYTRTSSISGIENLVNGEWVTSGIGTASSLVTYEAIGAGYATLNIRLDTSSGLIIGARYEYSHNSTDKTANPLYAVDRRLGKLFPGIFYNKKLGDNSSLQLSYTSRITRPSYSDLASYVTYNDPVSVFTGNPALKPTITHNFKLAYNEHNYLFSLLYSQDTNPILGTQIATGPAKGIIYLAPQNGAWQRELTLQASIPVKVADWWDMNYTLIGGPKQYRVEYTPAPFEKSYLSWSLNFTEAYKLPRQWSLEISGYYNSPAYSDNSRGNANGMLNAGIKKDLGGNRGSLQLSVSDLLRSANYSSHIGGLTQDAFSSDVEVNYRAESSYRPIIKLSYYRSFGSSGNKSHKENAAADERRRL